MTIAAAQSTPFTLHYTEAFGSLMSSQPGRARLMAQGTGYVPPLVRSAISPTLSLKLAGVR